MATYRFQIRQAWAETFEVEADNLGQAHKKADEIAKTYDVCTDTANLVKSQAVFLTRVSDTEGDN